MKVVLEEDALGAFCSADDTERNFRVRDAPEARVAALLSPVPRHQNSASQNG